MSQFNNVVVVQSLCLKHLFTIIRNVETPRLEFVRHSKRIMRIICEEGLSTVKPTPKTVQTPTGNSYDGSFVDVSSIVAVSIIRSADAMLGNNVKTFFNHKLIISSLDVFMEIVPEATVGKVLIQRNEETAEAMFFYSKLPSLINKNIVLLDPMVHA